MVQGGAQGINIGAHIRFPAPILFRGRVARGNGTGAQGGMGGGVEQLDQPEIDQKWFAARGDADVGGLDIPVQHRRLLLVQVLQRLCHLDGPVDGTLVGHRFTVFQQAGQVFAFDVIHHQVLAAVGDGEVIGDARQVGV